MTKRGINYEECSCFLYTTATLCSGRLTSYDPWFESSSRNIQVISFFILLCGGFFFLVTRRRIVVGERRDAYRTMVGKTEGKRSLGRPSLCWEVNSKTDLEKRNGKA